MKYSETNINRPLSFISCGQFISPGGWTHSKRLIDSFEVVIGLKGVLYMQQDEEKFEVHPGDVLHLFPGHCHQGYAACEAGTSFYWLHYACRNPYTIIENESDIPEMSGENILIPVFSSPTSIEKIIIQFKQLLHIANSEYYTSLATDYLLTLIMIELSQQSVYNSLYPYRVPVESDSRLTAVLEWIRINICRDISIEELAYEFKFNKDYLCRLFKKRLGTGVKSYINSMKAAKAKELLCCTNKSIKEIAYCLGFNDEKYFMRLFKEYEQLTPTEYRKAYYKTHMNNK